MPLGTRRRRKALHAPADSHSPTRRRTTRPAPRARPPPRSASRATTRRRRQQAYIKSTAAARPLNTPRPRALDGLLHAPEGTALPPSGSSRCEATRQPGTPFYRTATRAGTGGSPQPRHDGRADRGTFPPRTISSKYEHDKKTRPQQQGLPNPDGRVIGNTRRHAAERGPSAATTTRPATAPTAQGNPSCRRKRAVAGCRPACSGNAPVAVKLDASGASDATRRAATRAPTRSTSGRIRASAVEPDRPAHRRAGNPARRAPYGLARSKPPTRRA